MSEQWHQHLQNLTFWEQIDRFLNPNKYSCSTNFLNDDIWHIFLIVLTITVITTTLLMYWLHKQKETPT